MVGYSIRQLQRDGRISFRRAREAMAAAELAGSPIRSAADAVAWLARPDENDGPEFLAILHPDDPRHGERLAASVIREIEIAVDKGERLLVSDVGVRMVEELAVFKSGLLAIPGRVALLVEHASPAEVERIVAAELDSALAGLIADDPDTWPDAVLTPPSPLDDRLHLECEVDPTAEYMPQLHPNDPRYRHHAAQAELRARELEKLWSDTIPFRHVCAAIREQYEIVREHFAWLPTRVVFAMEDGDAADVASRKIQIEIACALQELEKEE